VSLFAERRPAAWPPDPRFDSLSPRKGTEQARFSRPKAKNPLLSSGCVVTFARLPAPGKEEIMTKTEFVDQVAAKSDLGKGEAAKAVDAVLDTIQETLTRGSEVSFTGFGKFSVADRSAREGVNPQTGEKIHIAASKVPRFSAGSALKKAVKGGS
jgi:DNA-binding protein HU-beta